MRARELRAVASLRWVGEAFTAALLVFVPAWAGAGPAPCNSGTYVRHWFGEDPVACVNSVFPNNHTCPLTQSFYCADGSPASDPGCGQFWDGGQCAVAEGADCGWFKLCEPYDCAARHRMSA